MALVEYNLNKFQGVDANGLVHVLEHQGIKNHIVDSIINRSKCIEEYSVVNELIKRTSYITAIWDNTLYMQW